MSAGVASAEVAVTGDGRMGVQSPNGGYVAFGSRIRIVFTAPGETDNGLTFGGSIRAGNAGKGVDTMHASAAAAANPTGLATGLLEGDNTSSGGGVSRTAGEVYIAGAFGTVTMADNPGPAGDQALSGAMTYIIGDVGFGVGVERLGDNQNIVAGLNAALGDASIKVVFGSNDDNNAATEDDQYGASASFVSGSATFTAFTSRKNDQDHFGIGASFDLGGNAKIVGGFVDGDSLADSSFDLGVTMGF